MGVDLPGEYWCCLENGQQARMAIPARTLLGSIGSVPPLLAGALATLCYAGSFIAVRDVAGVVPPAAAGGTTPATSRTAMKLPA